MNAGQLRERLSGRGDDAEVSVMVTDYEKEMVAVFPLQDFHYDMVLGRWIIHGCRSDDEPT